MNTTSPNDIPPYDPARSTPELQAACPNCGSGHWRRDDDYMVTRDGALYGVCGFCHRLTGRFFELEPPVQLVLPGSEAWR